MTRLSLAARRRLVAPSAPARTPGPTAVVVALAAFVGCASAPEPVVATRPAVGSTERVAATLDATSPPAAVIQAALEVDELRARGRDAEAMARWPAPPPPPRGTKPDPVTRFLAAWAMRDRDAAWKIFKQLTDEQPTGLWGNLGQARIYAEWKIDDRADGFVERVLAAAPDLPIGLKLRGDLQLRRGALDDAATTYGLVAAKWPDFGHGQFGLGEVARLRGDSATALTRYTEALAAGVDTLALRERAADAAEATQQRAVAVQHVRAAVKHAPMRVELHRRLSKLLAAEGLWDEALASLVRTVDLAGNDFESALAMAEAYGKLGRTDEELEAYRSAESYDPENPALHAQLARLYLARDELAGAEEALRRVLLARPGDVDATLSLARIYARTERLREAMQRYGALLHPAAGAPAPSAEIAAEAGRELAALREKAHVPAEPTTGKNPNAIYDQTRKLIMHVYIERTKEHPRLRGKITVTVDTQKTGEVTEVAFVEDTLHDPVLEALVYFTLKEARFPADVGRRKYTLSYELEPPK